MLTIYDHLEDLNFYKRMEESAMDRCKFYASDLMNALDYDDLEMLGKVICTAERACIALNIPIKHNFKVVYRCDDNGIYRDWKLSYLACYLITINGDPINPSIAKAQLFRLTNHFQM